MEGGHPLRTAIGIQAAFAALFLVVALAGRSRIQDDVFDGSAELYWVLVVGVLAYAVSYFARGWLAGHSRFGLYGGLVLLESCSRCLFALAVVIGVLEGQGAVALGIAAAPLVSLMVVPWALRGRDPAPAVGRGGRRRARLQHPLRGGGAGDHGRRAGAAQRARWWRPTSRARTRRWPASSSTCCSSPARRCSSSRRSRPRCSPTCPASAVTDGREDFARALRVTLLAIWGFAGAVVLGLALIGPWAMGVLFGGDFDYARGGLVLVGFGMGFHLTAGTLNQAALARDRAGLAAAAWLGGAALFLGWLFASPLDDSCWRSRSATAPRPPCSRWRCG